MYQRIVEPLIRTYGAFRVRQLILEMEGREPRTLEVCRLTLADDLNQEAPLKTIHNSRTDLPWVVYAVEEYLDNLKSYMRQLDNERYEDVDQEKLAEGLRRLSEVSDEQWAQAIARQVLTPHPRQRDLIGIFHRRASEALQELKASNPEGIPDILETFRAENNELDQAFMGDAQNRLGFWRSQLERPQRFTPILGEQVLQVGTFYVFEDFGYYAPTDVHLTPLQQREDGTWVNTKYMLYFQSSVSLEDMFTDVEARDAVFEEIESRRYAIGGFTSLNVPEVAQLCEPVSRWLAEKRENHKRNRDWLANYKLTLKQQLDSQAYEALEQAYESLEAEEDESERYDEEYQEVYDAWVALGCIDAPTDNLHPAFDPTTAVVFGADRIDTEEPQ